MLLEGLLHSGICFFAGETPVNTPAGFTFLDVNIPPLNSLIGCMRHAEGFHELIQFGMRGRLQDGKGK
ncbi:hypothetical protein RESH_04209 [Rhodopirellula europaea SH398]|uniref:Uncharacterized protein n=1 Tax=Rhodopirellula europaea SH398 TaxID=1263868 RepID=M5SC39_9BACT|nr:hypothetical protein RESH_04209 [Rhodopirellula europaea SH398]